MVHISRGLRQVNLVVRDRFCDHLSLIALHLEGVVRFIGQTTALLRRFETIFEAVDLTSFALSVTDHLRTDRVDVHELLAASCIAFLRATTNWVVVAHGRQTLVGNPPQVAALVEADLVLPRRLHHLRLVHNLADLLLKQTVGQNPSAALSTI